MTSFEQPSQDPQPGRAGSDGWCAGGPCSQRGRTFSGLAGCGGAKRETEWEEEGWLVVLGSKTLPHNYLCVIITLRCISMMQYSCLVWI